MNKTDNYFERIRQKSNRKKYRYYFFDYLYFKGEQWHKKAIKCYGDTILGEYWYLVVAIPAFAFIDAVGRLGHYALIAYYAVLFLFPFLFTFLRYRKDRTAAIVNHYRHSKSSGVTMTFIIILPVILCAFELWILSLFGWVECHLW